jgi:phage-related minor tail protein
MEKVSSDIRLAYPRGAAVVPGPVALARVKPFDFLGMPAELVNALRVLPLMADRLDQVAENTDDLATIREAIVGVKRDTSVLPAVGDNTAAVSEVARQLGEVAEAATVLPGIDARLTTIEEAMPALVEVQQHLASLPETIGRLSTLMEGLLESIQGLDERVDALQHSIEPLGRVAERLPGKNR